MNLFGFYIIFLFTLTSVNVNANSKLCGEINQITGKVDVLRAKSNADSERVAIHVNTPFELWCTDVVVTRPGSRAKIKTETGLITLSPNTRLNIASVKKGTQAPSVLNLTFGKIRTFFKEKEDEKTRKDRQTKLRIKTPTAVVGVRGTDFYVSFDANKDVTTQATIKGEVEVEQVGTGQKAIVDTGKQVEVVKVDKEDLKKFNDLKKEEASLKNKISKTQNNETKESEHTAAAESLEKTDSLISDIVKPLEVKPIETETVVAIRQTSPLINQDQEFTSPEAVKVLGTPEKWIPATDEIPGDLKDIKNVF